MVGSGTVAVVNGVSSVAISTVGITSAGVAGSTAAGIQAGIGAVQAGSWFAGFQTMGAVGGGILGAAFWPVTIGVGVAFVAVPLAYKYLPKNEQKK